MTLVILEISFNPLLLVALVLLVQPTCSYLSLSRRSLWVMKQLLCSREVTLPVLSRSSDKIFFSPTTDVKISIWKQLLCSHGATFTVLSRLSNLLLFPWTTDVKISMRKDHNWATTIYQTDSLGGETSFLCYGILCCWVHIKTCINSTSMPLSCQKQVIYMKLPRPHGSWQHAKSKQHQLIEHVIIE